MSKTQIQELKLANNLFAGLHDGGKRVTIRRGRRDIQLGALVFSPVAADGTKPVRVEVTEVRYKRLKSVTNKEAQSDGFLDAKDMRKGMKKYYPGLKVAETVTFIIFEC